MSRFRKYLPGLVAALVGVAMLGVPNQARATFQLRYSTTGQGGLAAATIITDGGAGDIDGLANGSITTATITGLTIHASSTSFISTGLSTLDLQVSGTADGNPLNLVVQASINGITTAPSPQILTHTYGGSILPPGGTTTSDTWVSQLNTTFTTSPSVAHSGPMNLNGPTDVMNFSATVPYSMTTQISVTGSPILGSQLSLDSNNSITPTPAPAGLVLALTGMPVLGVGAWVRRRRTATAA